MAKRAGHKEALRRDPDGPYASGFKARKGTKPPIAPPRDLDWMRREWKAGQKAKGRRR